jgi:hypothetical protein
MADNYFVAGVAAGAGAGAGVASGAGAGAGAAVGAGFCSSAFLQPTTADDKVTKKSSERIMANTFFIECHLLSQFFTHVSRTTGLWPTTGRKYAFFLPCQDNFLII